MNRESQMVNRINITQRITCIECGDLRAQTDVGCLGTVTSEDGEKRGSQESVTVMSVPRMYLYLNIRYS